MTELERTNSGLMSALNISMVFFVFAISLFVVAIIESSLSRLLISAFMFFAGFTAYRYGVKQGRDLALSFKFGLDFYRFNLLKALNIPLPHDSLEEYDLWRKVSEWFAVGEKLGPLYWEYMVDGQPSDKLDNKTQVRVEVSGLATWMIATTAIVSSLGTALILEALRRINFRNSNKA